MKKMLFLVFASALMLVFPTARSADAPKTPPAPGSGGTMTLYYAPTTDWADPVIQEFQELTGIEVEMVNAGASELFSRIVAESANPLADVVWGGSADTYASYKKYLLPYKSTEHDFIDPSCVFDGNYAYGWCMEPSLFIYNKKLVSADEAPKGWADLANPKWKGKIALADPTKSSSAFGALVTIYQACGEKIFEDIVRNLDGKVVNGTGNVYKYTSDGEYLIGVAFEEMAMKYIDAGGDLTIVYPSEGIPMAPSAVGIVKGGKNPENAKKFIDFMLGKTVQSQMAGLWRRTSRTDLPAPATLPSLDNLVIMDTYDPTWALEHGQELAAKFRDLITE